ncbi:hypothetical protein G3W13_28610, partial [Klebsiella pneumoniae]|nr:hypothetical protein [Klebsiella pneumoniae]
NDKTYYQNRIFAIAQVDEADNITGVQSDISKELAVDIIAAANMKRSEINTTIDSLSHNSKISTYNTESFENRFEAH